MYVSGKGRSAATRGTVKNVLPPRLRLHGTMKSGSPGIAAMAARAVLTFSLKLETSLAVLSKRGKRYGCPPAGAASNESDVRIHGTKRGMSARWLDSSPSERDLGAGFLWH